MFSAYQTALKVRSVEQPPTGIRVLEVPEIRAAAQGLISERSASAGPETRSLGPMR
jgi:hypothetical protein